MIVDIAFRHMKANQRLENYINRKSNCAVLFSPSINKIGVRLDQQKCRSNEHDHYDCHLIGHIDKQKPINIVRSHQTASQAVNIAFEVLYRKLRVIHEKKIKYNRHENLKRDQNLAVAYTDDYPDLKAS